MVKSWLSPERSKAALEQYAEYGKKYVDEIERSIFASSIYRDDNRPIRETKNGSVGFTLDTSTSTDEIFKMKNLPGKTAILNFADFIFPGGGFLQGAFAQEEAICHGSTLYNVLSYFKEEYEYNKTQVNDHLYKNFAVYSPGVVFNKGSESTKCDVITCAAPYTKRTSTPEFIVDACMEDRCRFVLDVARDNGVDNLILGAFGCGVFGNDPNKVAKYFKDMLSTEDFGFKNVVFAIPGGPNYDAFLEVFNDNI